MDKRDHPRFSRAEIEHGGALPPRVLEFAIAQKMFPQPDHPARPGGRPAWETPALGQGALIGAFYGVTQGVALAIQLANLVSDLRRFDRSLSRLNQYHDFDALPAYKNADSLPGGKDDDYNWYVAFRRHCPTFDVHLPTSGDKLICIVDQQYIFSAAFQVRPNDKQLTDVNIKSLEPIGVIEGLRRIGPSETLSVRPFDELLPDYWYNDEEKTKFVLERVELTAAKWKTATTIIRINASLAVRKAYRRVYDRRHGIEA